MNILEIKNLSMSYDGIKPVLSECQLSLEAGKICAIVGESGSGKSTLLRLIAGLEKPSEGKISINGTCVSGPTEIVSPQNRSVGLVFQDFALFPHLTVAENITFALDINASEILNDVLKRVQMEKYAYVYPSELSGGQKQRVAIARTLAVNPHLLLLDEPFSNLDSSLKTDIRQEIRNIVKQLKKSMIFITHDLHDALDIADEVIFLHQSKIISHLPISALKEELEDTRIQKLVNDAKLNAKHILSMLSL